MRVLIHTSAWARWAQRLGVFVVPLGVLAVIMHRQGVLESTHFLAIMGLMVALAVLAVLFGIIALVRLWYTGDRGWGRAIAGMVLGLLTLAPLGYALADGARYPQVADLSTDPAQPLLLQSNILAPQPGPGMRAAIAEAFPTLQTRRYDANAEAVFAAAKALVEGAGWTVLSSQDPLSALSSGQINALTMTLAGWRDEVVVRVAGTNQGSTVNMRSASLAALADLGQNGRRIEWFLSQLDTAVAALPRATAPASDEDDTPAVVVN